MDTHRLAQFIATLILANCAAHLDGTKSRADWDREQVRLWTRAKRSGVAADVLRLVSPTQVVGQ